MPTNIPPGGAGFEPPTTRASSLGPLTPEALLDLVVRNAPLVLFATDRDGIEVVSRGRALQAMGLAEGELVGR